MRRTSPYSWDEAIFTPIGGLRSATKPNRDSALESRRAQLQQAAFGVAAVSDSTPAAKIAIDDWWKIYNGVRSRSSLNSLTPPDDAKRIPTTSRNKPFSRDRWSQESRHVKRRASARIVWIKMEPTIRFERTTCSLRDPEEGEE
jgi:hypothetical protein